MTLDKKPLPRFWYFPRGEKAVVIMTGDDHGNNGTAGRWDQFLAASPAGCSVEDWECVRGTSYMYPWTPMTDAEAAAYEAQGFEVGLHVNTNCADYTQAQLEAFLRRPDQWISLRAGQACLCRRHSATTASPGRIGSPVRKCSSIMGYVSIPAITSGRRAGCSTAPVSSTAPACRCGSLTSMAA